MTYEQQSKLLAGPMALLKVYLTRIGGEIAADSVQIWGGRGITKGGMGVYIEQFQRAYKFDSIVCPLSDSRSVLMLFSTSSEDQRRSWRILVCDRRCVRCPSRRSEGFLACDGDVGKDRCVYCAHEVSEVAHGPQL